MPSSFRAVACAVALMSATAVPASAQEAADADAPSAPGEGGPRVFLRADRSLDYGRVMAVMGELNRAGLNRVALVSVGEEER